MKTLTAKEKKAIEGLKSGKTKRQAVFEAYNCKNLAVADKIGQKLFKKEKVVKELQIWREKEREELLPKAMKKVDEILSANPDKAPSWDIISKTGLRIIDRNLDQKEGKTMTIINLAAKFIKKNKVGEYLKGKEIKIIRQQTEEEGSTEEMEEEMGEETKEE